MIPPKREDKQENSNKTSDELPKEAETSLGLTANLKKNFKNRFADVSISFRKNDDTVKHLGGTMAVGECRGRSGGPEDRW